MPVVSPVTKGITRDHRSPGCATGVVLGKRRSTSLTLGPKQLRKTQGRKKTSTTGLRAGSNYVRSRATSHLNLLRKLSNARLQFETIKQRRVRIRKSIQADSEVNFSNLLKNDTKLLPSTKVQVIISAVYKKRADLAAMRLRKGSRIGVVAAASSEKVEDDSDTDDTSEDTKDFTSDYSDDTDDDNDEFEPVKSYPLRKKDRLGVNKSPTQEPSSVEESSCESLPDLDFPIAVRWTKSDTTPGNKEKSTSEETNINCGTVSNSGLRKRRLTDTSCYSQSKSKKKIVEDKNTRSASNVMKPRSLRSREIDRVSSPTASSSWSSNKIRNKLETRRPTGSGSPKAFRSRLLQGVDDAPNALRCIDKKDQPKQSESTLQKGKPVVTAGPSHTTSSAEINLEAVPKRRGRGRPRKFPKIEAASEMESSKKSPQSISKKEKPLPKTRSQLKTTVKLADEPPKRQKQVTKFSNKTATLGWNKKPKNVTAVRARYNKLIAKSKVWKSDRKKSNSGSLWTNKVTNSIRETEKCISLQSIPTPLSTPPTLSTCTTKSDAIKTDLKLYEKVVDKQKQSKAEAFEAPFLKKHVCNVCNNMTFTRRYSLTKHLRTNQHKKMLDRTSGKYIKVENSVKLKKRAIQNTSLSKLNVQKKLPGSIPSSKFLQPKELPKSGSIPSSKFLQQKELPKSGSILSRKFLQPKKLAKSGSIPSSKFLQPKELAKSGSIPSSKFLQTKKLAGSGSIPSTKFQQASEGTSNRKPEKILLIEGDGLKSECMVFGGSDSNDKEKYIKVENDEKKSNSDDEESDDEEEESDDEEVSTVQEYITGKSLGKNNFVCLICQPNATFTRKVSFSVHLWNHRTDSDLKCQDCGMKFADSFSYNCHIDNAHADTTKYSCKYCKSQFSEMSYLEKHMNSHKRDLFERFICPQCDRRFTTHDLMARHFDYKHLAIDSRVQLIVDSSEDLGVHPKLPEFITCDNYSQNTNGTSSIDMENLRDGDEIGDEMPDIDLELYDESVDSISRRSSCEEHPSPFMSPSEYISNFPVEASQSYHLQHPVQRQRPINIVEFDSTVDNNDGFAKFDPGSVIFHNPILGCGYKVKTYKAAVSRSDSALTCVDCGKSFQNRRSLLKHVDYFTQVEKYSCTICKMKFKFKHHLHRHQLRHAPQKDSSGLKKPVFFKHRKLISRSLPKLLPVLPAGSQSSNDNVKIFKTEAVQESQIDEDYHVPQIQSVRTIQPHELEMLSPPPQTVLKCSDSAHSSTTFSCNFENCSKRFTEQSTLKIHGWFHQNENLFSCSECDAKCERKSDLELHFKCHETQQPFFLCYVCFKPFRWKKDMVRHVRKKHPAERTYKCLYCVERTLFRQSEELTSHISETHPEHRSFPCDYCGRRYAQRRYLLVHIQTQHEVEPDDGIRGPVVDEGGGDIYDGNFDEVEDIEYL